MRNPLRPSPLIRWLRRNGCIRAGVTELCLAQSTGMCKGVRRALAMVQRSLASLQPGGRLLLVRPIIHNPTVGLWLQAEGVLTLDTTTPRWWTALSPSDTVIVPAFGATDAEDARLREAGVALVDTTCPSVRAVWIRVTSYARDGFTTVLHGRPDHPETLATLSRVSAAGGHFLVVPDIASADALAETIAGGSAVLQDPPQGRWSHSPGFEPLRELQRIGMVNQTTMLASESHEIAGLLRAAAGRRFGRAEGSRFRSYGTICRATQEHQDAVRLLTVRPLDLMVVVGGHVSSNTRHLAELAARRARTLHVEGPDALESLGVVIHQPPGSRTAAAADISWLAALPCRRVGFAAGASTPDAEVGDTAERLLMLLGEELPRADILGPPKDGEPAAG